MRKVQEEGAGVRCKKRSKRKVHEEGSIGRSRQVASKVHKEGASGKHASKVQEEGASGRSMQVRCKRKEQSTVQCTLTCK